jgi:hypothetical protein
MVEFWRWRDGDQLSILVLLEFALKAPQKGDGALEF